MESLLQDLRFGVRKLVKNPGFSAVAVLTLTLGIGATSSIFSVVNGVFLHRLPYPEPDRLVLLEGTRKTDQGVEGWPLSHPDLVDWQLRSRRFEGLSAIANVRSFTLLRAGRPERVKGEMVSAGFFSLLGVEPLHGRGFRAEEDRAASPRHVAVVSHDCWQDRFGGRPGLVGDAILLNETRHVVVGITPPGFRGTSDQAEVWLPVSLAGELYEDDYVDSRLFRWLSAVGRLKPGVTLEQARQEMDSISATLAEGYPQSNEGHGVRLTLLSESWFGDLRTPLLTLLAAAGFVLLIACANVANLLLARSAGRTRELSLRAALGAGRRRLVRQLLTESLLLALLGFALGLLLASWGTSWLVSLAGGFRSFVDVSLDPAVVAAALLLSLVSGLGFGVAPVWFTSRIDLVQSLKDGRNRSVSFGSHRFRSGLVIAEMALAILLLVGAGVAIRAFVSLLHSDLGMEADNLLTVRMDLKGERYAEDEAKRALTQDLLQRLEALPGARSAAVLGPGIPTDDWNGKYFGVEEGPSAMTADDDGIVLLPYHAVTPGTFETLGVPLLRGRDFTSADRQGAPPTIIVSRALADSVWPGEDPIGKRLRDSPRDSGEPWITVVGVVGDVAHQGFSARTRPGPDVYLPLLQAPPSNPPQLNVVVRTEGVAPLQLAGALRSALAEVAPDVPLFDLASLEQRLGRQAAPRRFLVVLMSLFALLALSLAAIGIYGVVSFLVAEREHELGTRMALGASAADILSMVLRRALLLALTGVALGLTASVLLGRLASRLFTAIGPLDWWTMTLASLTLLGAAAAASLVPARRATRVDPLTALRGHRS